MRIIVVHDKKRIEEFLLRRPLLHLYALGDLDDFFWPHTSWYALEDAGGIRELALLYTGAPLPVLLAFAQEPLAEMARLLRGILPWLPRRLYAHLSGDLARVVADEYRVTPHGVHCRMGLKDPSVLHKVDTTGVAPLSWADLPELQDLYRRSYPGNWFDPRMLETGCYYGLREEGRLVSAAGVHVFSARHRAAALGNVATDPAARGRGLARRVCARLCLRLVEDADHVGLNVKEDNRSAIACYQALGFERIALYSEYSLASGTSLEAGEAGDSAIMPA